MAELQRVRQLRPNLSVLPPKARQAGTRGRILVAALELFAEHGFEATSIRDIAAEAALQSASLYTHFGSKEEILSEIVLRGHEEHHSRVVGALLNSGPDPRNQLRAIIREHVLVHCEYSLLAAVAIKELRSLSDSSAAPALVLREQSVQIVREVIQRGEEQGLFHLRHRGATVLALGALGARLAFWYPADEVDLDPESLAETYADLALRMVGVEGDVSSVTVGGSHDPSTNTKS